MSTPRYKDYLSCGDIYVGGGSIGESVQVTSTANFSLVPPTVFSKYYNLYEVSTNNAIIVTLPSPTNVELGWSCRISMISSTGTGSIEIRDHLGGVVARLTSNIAAGQARQSVVLTLVESTPAWCAGYQVPTLGTSTQVLVMDAQPSFKLLNYGTLYSLISNAGTSVNTTTDVAIQWNNPTNLFIDNDYYTFSGSNSRINAVVSGVFKFNSIIGINNVALATLTNLRIRPRINGVTFVTSFIVYLTPISAFASGVYWLNCMVYMAAGSYLEIMVGKSATSVGTNPLDASTSIRVQYISQT